MMQGRLGDAMLTLATDPRANAAMVAALGPLNRGNPLPLSVTAEAPLPMLRAAVQEREVSTIATVFSYPQWQPHQAVWALKSFPLDSHP